jgi:histidine kinase 2/3/4 (cytokinin receptor)
MLLASMKSGRPITLILITQMDGYEATQHIRKWEVDNCDQCRATGNVGAIMEEVKECTHHRLPVVAVTADVMKGTHELCFSCGMDDYIPKVCI